MEPRLITEEFISRLKKLNKICPHFHLSLQSGCSETLKRMNRKYTREDIQKVVIALRENFEDVILTADIIVGFPGETENEFNETYELLKEIKLYKIHVFQYSKREGTKAAGFPNQIPAEIKEKRSKKIIELSNKYGEEYNKQYIGKEVKVLMEEKQGEYYKGHTENYMYVAVTNADENIRNKIKKVKIEKIEAELLIGKLI